VELPGGPRCHLLLLTAWPSRRSPGDFPSDATPPPPPFLLSPGRPPSSLPSVSLSLLLVKLTVVHGRRLAPASRPFPSPADVLRRSPTSSSTSPSKELVRSASNRRRHRGYLAGEPSSPLPNCSPPAILRPNRAHRRTQGEPPVLLDPSPFLFPRRSARHGQPLPVSGSRSGWPLPQPTLASQRGLGPLWSVALGQVDPGCKKFQRIYLFQKNCCKYLKFVKCIEYSLYVRKMQMTNQNVQKNEIYILVPKSCIVNQL
jgi:hypothetical protein